MNYAAVTVEHREVVLKDKPRALLQVSAKGTVPVLVLADGRVIDESAAVMRWALLQQDPDQWWQDGLADATRRLVEENDLVFKEHLDHYKYADRYPAHPQSYYRGQAELFLRQLEQNLDLTNYLMDDQLSFSDVAIFPFVRQFAYVDKSWFEQAPYPRLRAWLQSFLDSDLFLSVMTKFPRWHEGQVND